MMHFFILAGGLGKRAFPLSLFKPKPLFPLGGEPLFDLMIAQLKKKSLKQGYVNLHYRSDDFKKRISQTSFIRWLFEEELSGSLVLRESLSFMEDMLLVVNGDIFIDLPIAEMEAKLDRENADGLILLRKSDSGNYPAIDVQGGFFKGRKEWQSPRDLMYTGVALLRRPVIEAIDNLNFVDTLIEKNLKISVMKHDGLWLDFGDPSHYYRANFEYLSHQNRKQTNSLSENATIKDGALIEGCIIWENTSISASCRIKNSIITGNMNLNNVSYCNKIITPDSVYNLI